MQETIRMCTLFINSNAVTTHTRIDTLSYVPDDKIWSDNFFVQFVK